MDLVVVCSDKGVVVGEVLAKQGEAPNRTNDTLTVTAAVRGDGMHAAWDVDCGFVS